MRIVSIGGEDCVTASDCAEARYVTCVELLTDPNLCTIETSKGNPGRA